MSLEEEKKPTERGSRTAKEPMKTHEHVKERENVERER